MGFVSFIGRVLFASVFLLSAYQEFNEFGVDGGPASKIYKPKFDHIRKHATFYLGLQLPAIEMRQLVAMSIALKGMGGILFILSSSFGACLLLLHIALVTPVIYDFYNYDVEKPQFADLFLKFTQNLALFGACLFFIGMKNSIPRRTAKKKVTKSKTT
ncbi:Nicotiana lesion-inducing like [Zostera marina]|uniref:Nicotiana lesion-inducing like n=1 Tax=Zostera marina TaxID=29655 RepID=A0A0K9PI48_ZOSMR|nr:Nicotiana lesion-inducing like [Zostera marina]